MPKRKQRQTKQNTLAASQSTIYYVGLVVQRISLLLAAASTVILWSTLIALAHDMNVPHFIEGAKLVDAAEINRGITLEISSLTAYAATLSLLAIIVTLLLLKLPRVRKYEKKMVVDGVVIAGFCFIFALYCEPLLRLILTQIVL